MAVFNKYHQFSEDLCNKVHDLFGTNDTLKVMLSNTPPNAATHAVRADASEIAAGNGYTAGGIDTQNDGTRSGATTSITGVDATWTAVTGPMATFQYVILYNDTPTSPADPLIGWWDYGEPVTLAVGIPFQTDFGTSMFTVS